MMETMINERGYLRKQEQVLTRNTHKSQLSSQQKLFLPLDYVNTVAVQLCHLNLWMLSVPISIFLCSSLHRKLFGVCVYLYVPNIYYHPFWPSGTQHYHHWHSLTLMHHYQFQVAFIIMVVIAFITTCHIYPNHEKLFSAHRLWS